MDSDDRALLQRGVMQKIEIGAWCTCASRTMSLRTLPPADGDCSERLVWKTDGFPHAVPRHRRFQEKFYTKIDRLVILRMWLVRFRVPNFSCVFSCPEVMQFEQ
jgi:hypothetical protein